MAIASLSNGRMCGMHRRYERRWKTPLRSCTSQARLLLPPACRSRYRISRSMSAALSTCSKRSGAITPERPSSSHPPTRSMEGFSSGVAESTPLDFYSPYGCSKGAADQYVRDYARVFGLRTVVLRMSCIYGPRQFGTEDQGWIAHFLIQAMRGRAITIYGDGYQVRDTLYVDDAVKAWIKALDQIDRVAGRVFNLGGGATNTVSLRELLGLMSTLRGGRPVVRFADWRPGDQPWYVSDIRAISAALDWAPATAVMNGLRSLERWLEARFSNSTPSIPLEQVRA